MNRLILLLGPIACALGGVGLSSSIAWALRQWMDDEETSTSEAASKATKGSKSGKGSPSAKAAATEGKGKSSAAGAESAEGKVPMASCGVSLDGVIVVLMVKVPEDWRHMLLEIYEELKARQSCPVYADAQLQSQQEKNEEN
eukprot:Skav233733  [mRNA]  locus=scaffold2225:185363:187338:+ [translate_table: standard]